MADGGFAHSSGSFVIQGTEVEKYIGGNSVLKKTLYPELDKEGNELKDVPSQELTLRNLGSKLTGELRKEMLNQQMLSAPIPTQSGDNYMGVAEPSDLIPSLTMHSENTDPEKNAKDQILNTISFGLYGKYFDGTSVQPLEHISLRVGDSPVINPPWQFNELDDIRSDRNFPHMGRVYLNYIYQNFPILVFQPGREKSNVNFLTFFGKGFGGSSATLNDYIRSGGNPSILHTFVMYLSTFKNLLLSGFESVLGALTGMSFLNAAKYITFKPAFKLYREITNNLLREFGANLGLIDLSGEMGGENAPNNVEFDHTNTYDPGTEDVVKSLNDETIVSKEQDPNYEPIAGKLKDYKPINDFQDSPQVIEKNPSKEADDSFGVKNKTLFEEIGDLKDVVGEKMKNFNSTYRGSFKKLDVLEMIPKVQSQKGEDSPWYNPVTWTNAQYLPFLCQNTITVSETFSNSTEQHPVAAQLNSMSQERAQDKSMGGAGKLLESLNGLSFDNMTGGGFIEQLKGIAGNLAINVATGLGKDMFANASELGVVINGGGKMMIPEIWSSSSFSRSYSVDFEFWSPVGDIVSIFENAYIPMLLLLVLASPIQTGYNSYASPFSIKVYSKGLFSVDFGMIESMTITRGEEKNDRTKSNFPRTIKVSLQIKDLQPTLMLSVGGGAFWKYKRANTSMNEYIATMCNLSIGDRQNIFRQWKMFWSTSIAGLRDKFSLDNLGYNLSQTLIMKPIMTWNKSNTNIDLVKNQKYNF